MGDGRDNLPAPLTSFEGREREVAEVAHLLETERLVTLVGAPGVGKTRLALRVAAEVLGSFDDGVWLAELAPLSEASLMPAAVARGLGLGADANRPMVEILMEYLYRRHILLVLDNCEHLLDTATPLVGTLLEACSSLHILTTSRERLGLFGEVAWYVPSLSLPEPRDTEDQVVGTVEGGGETTIRALLQSEAGRLFVARARAVRPGFQVTTETADAIADICRHLDGIPLAIELAAARVRALAPRQIADRLGDRFALLTGGSRASLPRHRTLRALVDWSHGLLSEEERALLRRLSVFAGGWTLEAAEYVVQRETLNDVLDLLAGLVDKSLVVVDESDRVARYHLLETIRQYAAEMLRDVGEEPTLRDRHRDWFLTLVERAEPELVGPEQVRWLDELELDHGNVRAALRWCVQRSDVESALRFGAALWRFWEGRNHLAEGRAWLDELLALVPSPPRSVLECRAQFAAGRMALLQGDDETARRLLEPCLTPSQDAGDMGLVAMIHTQLGHLGRERGDLAEARSRYEASDQIWRELGDAWGIAVSLLSLGRLALVEGATDDGMTLGEESLRGYREVGDPTDISRALLFVGGAACDLGRLDEARAYYTEGLRVAASLRDRGRLCANLGGCAVLAATEGRPERAMRLAAMAAAMSETTGTALAVDERRRLDSRIEPIRRALGESMCTELFEQARRMTVRHMIAYALESEGDGEGADNVCADAGPTPDSRNRAKLTRRELEITTLVARGRSNREIADDLVVSERTVEWHVRNLLGKLGVHSRAQIAIWARAHRSPEC